MGKGPKLIDPSLYKQAGIDSKTGLPSRMVDSVLMLKNMKHLLRLVDEQDAVNRYKWFNLPCNILILLSGNSFLKISSAWEISIPPAITLSSINGTITYA